jgi:hypothetical protein
MDCATKRPLPAYLFEVHGVLWSLVTEHWSQTFNRKTAVPQCAWPLWPSVEQSIPRQSCATNTSTLCRIISMKKL